MTILTAFIDVVGFCILLSNSAHSTRYANYAEPVLREAEGLNMTISFLTYYPPLSKLLETKCPPPKVKFRPSFDPRPFEKAHPKKGSYLDNHPNR